MGGCWSRRSRKAPERARRRAVRAMANTIGNLNLTNPIKNMVSKRRKRYTEDGFNLDLAYITDRLIAMGFPAEKLEGVYRNHIDDVYKFLEQKHKDHYKIYNLCSERSYDACKFHERVSTYAFEDHNPPKIELIQPFCEDVDKWLNEDSRNVAAVHCKAGKGRTGTMVCCYLLHSRACATAEEALNFYGQKRAHDKKGVTIPSQRRYVEYYAALISGHLPYRANTLQIRELTMLPPPSLNGQCVLELCITQADPPKKFSSGCHEVRKGESCITIALDMCAPLTGDIKVEVYNKPKMMMRKDKLYHFWFNTFFVSQEVDAIKADSLDDSSEMQTFKLTLDKWQLDDAHKDKQHKLYNADFKVELIVQQIPATSAWGGSGRPRGCGAALSPAASPSASTRSDSSSEDPGDEPDDENWDSGEKTPSSLSLRDQVTSSNDQFMHSEQFSDHMCKDKTLRGNSHTFHKDPCKTFTDETHTGNNLKCRRDANEDEMYKLNNVKCRREAIETLKSDATENGKKHPKHQWQPKGGAPTSGDDDVHIRKYCLDETNRNDGRPVTFPPDRIEFCIGPYSHSLLEMSDVSTTQSSTMTSVTDLSHTYIDEKIESKIPKVSSDHTISSTNCERLTDQRICKTPSESKSRKYLFFQSKKDSSESKSSKSDELDPLKSPSASERRMSTDAGGYSKPRLSLGDFRASLREFSGKHFGTEQSKHKKKIQERSEVE